MAQRVVHRAGEDPLARLTFGGSEEAMSEIVRYRRAQRDLKTKRERGGRDDLPEAAEEPLKEDCDKKGRPKRGPKKT